MLTTFSYFSTDALAFNNSIVFDVPAACKLLSRSLTYNDKYSDIGNVNDINDNYAVPPKKTCGIISQYDPSWNSVRYNNTHKP
jgi:hypothetical protein